MTQPSNMSAAQYQRARLIFGECLSLDEPYRSSHLALRCESDAALITYIRALLESHGKPDSFLEHRPTGVSQLPRLVAELRDSVMGGEGVEVEGYRIVEELGRGGFGIVYRAEQASPAREVALKVMRASLADVPGVLEAEVRALARLRHAGIGHVYATGTAKSAAGPRPFFAMELIEGTPIVRWALESGLSRRERVEVMIRVCDAVAYAHQKGVIHRDLKPSNILVTPDGQPKVVDFGIAAVLGSSSEDAPVDDPASVAGWVRGTPEYMSPEQARGEGADTASDGFALGAVLFELLAGRPALDLQGVRGRDAVMAASRATVPRLGLLDPSLRGDLEAIVAKATKADRRWRYQNAAELSSDLLRYLHHEPLSARARTPGYVIGKLVRRHRTLAVASAAVLLVLLSGLVGVSLALRDRDRALGQAVAALGARDRALRETEQSLAKEALMAAQAHRANGRWSQVIIAADRALQTRALEDRIPAELLKVQAWQAMGEVSRAKDHLQKLVARGERAEVLLELGQMSIGGPSTAVDGPAMVRRAVSLGLQSPDLEFAEALLARSPESFVLGMERAVAADPFSTRANKLMAVAYFFTGRFERMEPPLRFLETVTPHDWDVPFMRAAMAYLVDRDPSKAKGSLQRLKQGLGPRAAEGCRRVLEALADITHPDVIAGVARPSNPAKAITQLLVEGWQVGRALGGTQGRASVAMPPFLSSVLDSSPRQSRLGFVTSIGWKWAGFTAANRTEAAKTAEEMQVGLLHLIVGDRRERAGELTDALKSYQAASRTPSFLPVASAASFRAARVALTLGKRSAGKDPAAQSAFTSAAVESLRYCIGSIQPRAVAELAREMTTLGPSDAARAILVQLHDRHPDDGSVTLALAETELGMENFRSAARLAESVLATNTKDRRAADLLRRARAATGQTAAGGH